MRLASFPDWLEEVTNPEHRYFHHFQITMFASISYVSTACLTSIPPTRGMVLTILAYTISELIAPLFCWLLNRYASISLVPSIGQVLQLTTSLVLAKVICHIAGQALSFKEIRQIGIVFLVTLYVTQLALLKICQNLPKSKANQLHQQRNL